MEVLAIIPARGGSKGIKRKNLVEINHIPLVAYSIKHALEAKLVNRIIVSTEDEEIMKVSLRYGAEVPFLRPAKFAEDHVLDWPVFEHVLTELNIREQYQPDYIVHLRPTTPYRKSEWIDEAINLLNHNKKADSIRSVNKPSQHPYRIFRIDSKGFLDPIMKHEHKEPYLLRRQDHPDMYLYNCVIDITTPKTILELRSTTGKNIMPFIMDAKNVFDIDSEQDLKIARCLMEGNA